MKIDFNQESIIDAISSDAVSEIKVSLADELHPNEILIFCGSVAHRKFTEIKNLKQRIEKDTNGPCQHDWDEELKCKKCGKELIAGAGGTIGDK